MGYGDAARYAAHGRAEIAAERRGPYAALLFRCRTYANRTSPDWTIRHHGHRAEPVTVINRYIAAAIRGGLTGEQIRCCLAEAGLEMPPGIMTMGRLFTLDLTQMKDSWIRYWCHIIPRVLVAATRGELDGVEISGRVYTNKEVREVVYLCVTAQAEDLQLWSRLVAWACDELYPEYKRRTGKEHKCQQRAVRCTYLYPSDW